MSRAGQILVRLGRGALVTYALVAVAAILLIIYFALSGVTV